MAKQLICLFCFLFSMFCVANTYQSNRNLKREKEIFHIVSQTNLSESVENVISPPRNVLVTNQVLEK